MPPKKSTRNGQSTKVVGDALERQVAQSYEALGYQVSRNLLIAGHQIDLVASRYVPGLGVLRIAIEAKHRERTVGINEVTPFINTARHLLSTTDISSAILVANTAISSKAKLAVGESSIRLLTADELNAHLFNNAESLFRVTADYEQKEIFRDYYPLEVDVDGKTYPDGADYLFRWTRSSTDRLLLVVGDFGSGKSTLLERCFYTLARERLKDEAARFPILLKLRGMRQFADIWSYIEASLRDYQYLTPPKAVFENELRSGRVAILLDGFDEIYSGADAHDRASYLDFLRPLLKTKSPVVLSSRPTFFDSFNDLISSARKLLAKEDRLERLPSFGLDPTRIAEVFGAELNLSLRRSDFANVMLINQLTAEKIREAIKMKTGQIKKHLSMTAEEFEERLYEIYDLEDLMTRPLLLDMVLKTMATGIIDIKSQKTVGASTLYDVYTQQAAKRDKDRSAADQFLTPKLRLEACRTLARAMYHKGEITLSPIEVAGCVKEVIEPKITSRKHSEAADAIARAITDIRTCSFLRFSDDDSFAFTHKSFFEFFVAQDLFLRSKVGTRAFLTYPRTRLNREMLYFLASYIRDQADFKDFVSLRMREHISRADKSFLQSLAFASAELLERNALSTGTVSGVEMAKAQVTGADAMMITIQLSSVRKVTGQAWKFHDVALESCQFSDFSLERSTFNVLSKGALFERCKFRDSVLGILGEDATMNDTDIDGGKFSIDCKLTSTDLTVGGGCEVTLLPSAQVAGTRISFRGCSIVSDNPRLWYSPTAKIDAVECDLMAIRIVGLDLVVGFSGRVETRITLRRCSGLVFVDIPEEVAKSDGFASVRKANPDLLLLDEKLFREARRFTLARAVAKPSGAPMRPGARELHKIAALSEEGTTTEAPLLLGGLQRFRDDLVRFVASRQAHQARIPKVLSDFIAAAA